ncbi:MAG: hypothetical protein M1528_02400 [Candidatus Marsarchaeota archaeon]|nr:hypothetical protein [Candidatus Marsarchaeota archaeon]MCL5115359.1 hypothetical protein [Candidatus Marsarchaeota archaeon]
MAGENAEEERLSRLNKVYLAIISRYKEYIEEKENISVVELPTLITPKNPAVSAKVEELKSSLQEYSYDKDFSAAAKKAFDFVRDNVEDVVLPLQFWLMPEETLAFMMGDSFDKNVLLCSLLVGLGNHSSKVVVVIRGDARQTFVSYEANGKLHIMNLESGIREVESHEALVKQLNIDDDVVAYEFNDRTYVDIS